MEARATRAQEGKGPGGAMFVERKAPRTTLQVPLKNYISIPYITFQENYFKIHYISGHVEAKHISGVSHQCGECGKMVKSRPALNQHKLIQHKK